MAKKVAPSGRKIQRSFDVGDNQYYHAVLFKQLLKEFSVFSRASQTGISKFESLKADSGQKSDLYF